jgi:hypothetical protein
MAMESGTKSGGVSERERQLKFVEELPAATIPILVHIALLLGFANIT